MDADFASKVLPSWMTESLRNFIVTTIVLLVIGVSVIAINSKVENQRDGFDRLQGIVDTLTERSKESDSIANYLILSMDTLKVKVDSVYAWQQEDIMMNRHNQNIYDEQIEQWRSDNAKEVERRELEIKILKIQAEALKQKGLWK